MNWDEVKELAPLYAVGALDDETAREVEASLLDATPDQQREIARWSDVAALLPQALPSPAPPDSLKEQLLSRIAGEAQKTPIEIAVEESIIKEGAKEGARISAEEIAEQTEKKILPFTSPRRAGFKIPRWSLAAATVLLTFTSGYLLWQNAHLNLQNSAIARERDDLKREVEGIVAPSTKVIAMPGDEGAPQANAKVVWDTKAQQWVIYIFDLPAPPSDKDYQLWYVTKDAKISAAVFRPDAQGRTVLKLTLPPQALTGLAATAVTLEPKGGSPQPTNTRFYLKAAI